MTNSNTNDKVRLDLTINDKDSKEPTSQPKDALSERLDAIENGLKVDLEESQKKVEELTKKVNSISETKNLDYEIVDNTRKSAHTMSLPMIEGAPIIEMKLEDAVGLNGIELIAKVKNADGKKFNVPYGCDIKKLDFSEEDFKDIYRTSFENLKTQNFELQDIDKNDLTGASKVEKNVVVDEGGLVNEVDRSSGTAILTGRKVRTTVHRDIRYYTIKHDGKKITLSSEELANVRK